MPFDHRDSDIHRLMERKGVEQTERLTRLAELPTGQWYLSGVESEEQLPPQGHHYSDQLHCFVKHYFIEEDRISFMVWVELA